MIGCERMRICICDDEQAQLEQLYHDIQQMKLQESVECILYQSAEELLFECQNNYPFDVMILDVQMKQMNGIELAHQIRKQDTQIPIVFLTSMKGYVYEGYEVQALRYLLKPVSKEKLEEILALIQNRKQQERYVLVEVNRERVKINQDEIIYMESIGHTCQIHTKKESYEVRCSMQNLMKQLDFHFINTHRSYIVNIKEIERIGKETCVLSNQTEVPISRSCLKAVNEAFIQYYRKEIQYD